MLHHNNPPPEHQSVTDASSVYQAIAAFLADAPVVDTPELAQAATQMLSNGKKALKELEAARDAECDPLRAKWENARERWRKPIEVLGGSDSKKNPKVGIIQLVADRLAAYMRAEEEKRQAALAEARRLEREAEEAARKAEAAEKEAIDNAKVGECVDVAGATRAADAEFEKFQAAEAAAREAARNAKVRTRGAYDERATSLRTQKTLRVADAGAAFKALWPGYGDKGLSAAFLTAARQYRKDNGGALPAGIVEDEEKVL